jgi:geranylgeranyl diphosphate synthase type II
MDEIVNITEIKKKIELRIEAIFELYNHPIYTPMQHILRLSAKRSRPIITVLSFKSFSDAPIESVLDIALAIEWFHNFTLVHDDIMDNAPTRRGQPAIHAKWDINTAILVGDVMFSIAYQLINRTNTLYLSEILSIFSDVAAKVCEGQYEDLRLANKNEVTHAEYIEMIRKKTAVLMGGAIALGAVSAGADAKTTHQLQAFGEQAGIGFQLQDDWMDAFPPSAHFGKVPGGDIIENKNTFLWIKALEIAPEKTKAALMQWRNSNENDKKVKAVIEIYKELGIQQLAQDTAQKYYQQADRIIDSLVESYPKLTFLRKFIADLLNRAT